MYSGGGSVFACFCIIVMKIWGADGLSVSVAKRGMRGSYRISSGRDIFAEVSAVADGLRPLYIMSPISLEGSVSLNKSLC